MTRRNIIIAVTVAALVALLLAAFSKWVLPFLPPVVEDFLLFLGVAILAVMATAEGLPALVSLVESFLPPPTPPFFRPVKAREGSSDPLRYESRATPVFGQEHVYTALDGFLRDDRRFLWWLLSGPAGRGKSRLAYEWALLIADDRSARCDVLDLLPASLTTDDLNAWTPPRDTVIVVDDAGEHAGTVAELLECLTERLTGQGPRVRLLLVERSLPDAVRRTVERVTPVQHVRYQPDDLAPIRLDAGQVDALAGALAAGPEGRDNAWTAEQLAEIERVSEGNPLIALAAAQLLAERGDLKWEDRAALLDEWAQRFESKLILGGLDPACLPLVALATLVGELRWDAGIEAPEACANPRMLASLLGAPAQDALPPVRPDLLGEAFALRVCGGLTAPETREMATRAWQADAEAYAKTLYRLHHDFPAHPQMALLDAPPDGAEALGWWGEVRVGLMGEAGVNLGEVSRHWARLQDVMMQYRSEPVVVLTLVMGAVNATHHYGINEQWEALADAWATLQTIVGQSQYVQIQRKFALGAVNTTAFFGGAGQLDRMESAWTALQDLAAHFRQDAEIQQELAMGAYHAAYAYGIARQWEKMESARAILRTMAVRFAGDADIPQTRARCERNAALAYGWARREAGDVAGAKRFAEEARAYVGKNEAYGLARVETLCGNMEAALVQLRQAKELGNLDPVWTWRNPELEPLRDDPRFAEIVGPQPL